MNAVGNFFESSFVILAAAGFTIEKLASNVGPVNLAGVPILKFVEAALSAPVTKRFPFGFRHLRKGLCFPERLHKFGVNKRHGTIEFSGILILKKLQPDAAQ